VYDPKISKRSKSSTPINQPPARPETATIYYPFPSQDQIRERAYELYEGGGRHDGRAGEDWLTAEQQILNEPRREQRRRA